MVFYNIDVKSKDANKCRWKANMIRDRPEAIGCTSGFSQDSISITVGEQIIVEQLIEKRIIMRLSRHDHVYRHHVRNKHYKKIHFHGDTCLSQ